MLEEKIQNRSALIAVAGLGYVGLPLAVAFAGAGFRVIGLDVQERKVDAVNRGESYIEDISSEELKKNRFFGKTDRFLPISAFLVKPIVSRFVFRRLSMSIKLLSFPIFPLFRRR